MRKHGEALIYFWSKAGLSQRLSFYFRRAAASRRLSAANFILNSQAKPVFKHGHDLFVDSAGDIYLGEWNADRRYPSKLTLIK